MTNPIHAQQYQNLTFPSALFMCFDLETTGVNVLQDRIVQIAASYFYQGDFIQQHCQLINPQQPIPSQSTAVHHIGDDEVRTMPIFEDFFPRFIPHLRGEIFPNHPTPIILGYNIIDFDLPLLHAEIERTTQSLSIELACIDLMVWVRWCLRHDPQQKLTQVCERFGISLHNAHDALADARACGWLLKALVESQYIPLNVAEALRLQAHYQERLKDEYTRYKRWLYHDRQTQALKLGNGKYIGSDLSAVDIGYFKYILGKVKDLPTEVRTQFEQRVAQG